MKSLKSSLSNHLFVQMQRALRRPARDGLNTTTEVLVGSDGFEERKNTCLKGVYPVEIRARADFSLDVFEKIAEYIMVSA